MRKNNYIDLKNRIKQLLEIAKIKNKKTAFFICSLLYSSTAFRFLIKCQEASIILTLLKLLFSHSVETKVIFYFAFQNIFDDTLLPCSNFFLF